MDGGGPGGWNLNLLAWADSGLIEMDHFNLYASFLITIEDGVFILTNIHFGAPSTLFEMWVETILNL